MTFDGIIGGNKKVKVRLGGQVGFPGVPRPITGPKVQTYIVEGMRPKRNIGKLLYGFPPVAVLMLAVCVTLGFILGVFVVLSTRPTIADRESESIIASTSTPLIDPIPLATSTPGMSNDLMFNIPLEDLEAYVAYKTSEQQMQVRKEKLRTYLKEKGSPFVEEVDTIAVQPHWKLILAISFAESTLGKKCYVNNCSGIGGSQIKTYNTKGDWVLDFNNLLERRYKDKTLEQMCGVYVQPCNPNWLYATKQILGELKDRAIE